MLLPGGVATMGPWLRPSTSRIGGVVTLTDPSRTKRTNTVPDRLLVPPSVVSVAKSPPAGGTIKRPPGPLLQAERSPMAIIAEARIPVRFTIFCTSLSQTGPG